MAVIGYSLWIVPFMLIGLAMVRAQLEYVRHYREYHNVDLPLPMDLPGRLIDPRISRQLWRIVWEPQQDPPLELLRRRVVRYWYTAIGYAFVGWIILLAVGFTH